MFNKKTIVLLASFFVSITIPLISLHVDLSQDHNGAPGQDIILTSRGGKIVLIIFRENLIFCPLCRVLIDDFLARLSSLELEASSIGIFVPMKSNVAERNMEHSLILKKRIKKLFNENEIRFPIVIAEDESFSEKVFEDTDILFINLKRKTLTKYQLPLSIDQWKELIAD